jgi:hypothetical protein
MGETLHKELDENLSDDFIVDEINLEDILVLDFFKAIKQNKPELINATEIQLKYLLIEYQSEIEKINGTNVKEHKIKVLSERYYKTLLLVKALLNDFDDVRLINAIRLIHPNFNETPTDLDIETLLKENDVLYEKIESIRNEDANSKENKGEFDVYKSIANLSVNFKFRLNPKELTLKEYLTYIKIAKDSVNNSN